METSRLTFQPMRKRTANNRTKSWPRKYFFLAPRPKVLLLDLFVFFTNSLCVSSLRLDFSYFALRVRAVS